MKIVSVKINNKDNKYNTNDLELKLGDYVVVDTDRGNQVGIVSSSVIELDKDNTPSYFVIRIANKEDLTNNDKNIKDAKKALKKCRELANKEELNMYIIDATYSLDKSQLFFRFMADNRVDFRNLAKELANIFKTRIELRQIGVRDRAKEVSGFGPCGRPLCCSKFMSDFDSVSINMAKTQNIALNPSKINGVCGRLLCCLKYEQECYKECSKGMPQLGKKIKTEKGEGKVIALDVLKSTYKVNIPDVGIVEFSKDNNESN